MSGAYGFPDSETPLCDRFSQSDTQEGDRPYLVAEERLSAYRHAALDGHAQRLAAFLGVDLERVVRALTAEGLWLCPVRPPSS